MRRHLLLTGLVGAQLVGCKPSGSTTTPDSSPAPPSGAASQTPMTKAQILASSDLPKPMESPLAQDSAKVSVHRLSNGMTVYLSPNHDQPHFDAWVSVRTGSRNDPANSTGLAHYLEHMMFKGTDELGTLDFAKEKVHLDAVAKLYDELRATQDPEKRHEIFTKIDAHTQSMAKFAVPNELDRLYESIGVKGLNAFTSKDQTTYIGQFPANRLEAWAKVEAERFQDPQFRLFFPELEAVYEEKNRSMDNPASRSWDALHANLFPTHPYGTQTPIGSIEHLKTPAYGDMVRYFSKWYRPNNMAIALSGDFDRKQALEILERNFGGWDPAALDTPAPAKIEALTSRSMTKIVGPGHPGAMLAWVLPAAGHVDQPALDVMDALVFHQGAGMLSESLLLTQKLPSAQCMPMYYREAGSWILSGQAGQGQTPQQVEALLLGVVDRIKKGDFSAEQLAAVKLNLEIDRKKSLESTRSRVQQMSEAFIQRRSWAEVSTYIDKIRAVSKEDVLRVAAKYLGKGYAVVLQERGPFEPPSMQKPNITPVPIDANKKSPYFSSVLAMPSKAIEPRWVQEGQDFARLTGKRPGLAVQNSVNDLFHLRFRYAVGSAKSKYLCHALKLAERSGTKTKSAAKVKKELYALGSQVTFGCNEDESHIDIQGIDRNLDPSLALVQEWLTQIQITDEDAQKYASNQIASRRTHLDNPRFLGRALSSYAMRGKQSPFLRAVSNGQLQGTKGSTLAKAISSLLGTRYDLAYYGPRNAQALTQLASLGKASAKPAARKSLRYASPSSPKIFLIDRPTAQASIFMQWKRKPATLQERVLAKVANAYLGGMGGLLFQEVREARGLAYTVAAMAREGKFKNDDGELLAYVGTQADKAPEAISVVLEQLRRPVQPSRLDSAKTGLIEELRAGHLARRAIVGAQLGWDKAGYAQDPRKEEYALIKSVDADALTKYLQKLANAPVTLSIVGPKSRINVEALAKFGKIKELKPEQVFGYGSFPQNGPAAVSRR